MILNKVNLECSDEEINDLLECVRAAIHTSNKFKSTKEIAEKNQRYILLRKRLYNLKRKEDKDSDKYKKHNKLGNLYNEDGSLNVIFE